MSRKPGVKNKRKVYKVGAKHPVINNEAVSHPDVVALSEYCSISWPKFQQAMINANHALYDYKPLCKLPRKERIDLARRFDNRYVRPTHEEMESL